MLTWDALVDVELLAMELVAEEVLLLTIDVEVVATVDVLVDVTTAVVVPVP